jgi:para-aminobenzoate synthetase component 1
MSGTVLLDSTGLGKNTFFADHPTKILSLHNHILSFTENQITSQLSGDPLEQINQKMQETSASSQKSSGWIGYVSYEAAKYILEYKNIIFMDTKMPEIWFAYYPEIRRDNILIPKASPKRHRTMTDSQTQSHYQEKIATAKKYIHEGDIYQVNLSHRFTTEIPIDPFELYRRQREVCPAPYSAYLDIGNHHILSSSPELFFEITNGIITTRPIKGTIPRGKTPEEDHYNRHSLTHSEKDHAELLMITDLERNDLGKICEYGSVTVTEHAKLETYSHVHHLVSTITGKLKKNVTPFQSLLALFPGGSITGAPKKRAMEIIQALETTPREVYTGAIGYITDDGDTQFNIAIRTAYTEGKNLHFHAGGGITADSDPKSEWDETCTKAKGFIETVL